MSEIADIALVGGAVVTETGPQPCDIAVKDGRIAAVGRLPGAAARIVDCRGLTILPGVIDTHVHFREPGLTDREDIESGSRAAVLGGVTAIFEMPNTDPPTTSEGTLADKLRRARGRMHCDYAFFAGATPDNIDALPALERQPGCAGIKVLMATSSGPLLVESDADIRRILVGARRRVVFHCEDESRLRERATLRVAGDVHSHLVWRDEKSALLGTQRLLALARQTGKRVHIVHVSSASEIDLLRANRDIATVEVTPHHLTFQAPDCYDRLGALVQINPPIRDGRHRDALWQGLQDGTVDIVGSDHTPQLMSEKTAPYPHSRPGMPGVQTLLPLLLNAVHEGRLSLPRLVELTSAGPARVFGVAGKGRIAVGGDADLTVVDLKQQREVTDAWIASRAKWTSYAGMRLTGWPIGTFVRGRQAVWDGEILGTPQGQPVAFN